LVSLLLCLCVTVPALAQGVVVKKEDAVIRRRTFHPRRPPRDMPSLDGGDAITHSNFSCEVFVAYDVVERLPEGAGEGCTASARINSVEVKLTLEVTIWLPTYVRPKLAAHEEGHREIYERIYREAAERAARAEAEKLLGRTFTAGGADCRAAVEAAIRKANQRVMDGYVEATAGWAHRVGTRYDELTRHGRLDVPGVEEAIRQSFEDEPQEKVRERSEGRGRRSGGR
jgi:hypothetical protein